jgi:hypothetical protein
MSMVESPNSSFSDEFRVEHLCHKNICSFLHIQTGPTVTLVDLFRTSLILSPKPFSEITLLAQFAIGLE